ncbi:MAG TPA: lysylphosphatidylglycerol synthase transmembrane domain-containing protein [Burkholderiaceae bacterium]
MQRKLYVGLIISACLSAALYLAFIVATDSARIWATMGRLGWLGWGMVLALSLFNYGLRFLRWEACLRRLSAVRIERWLHWLYYLAGFAFTTTPGKAGEALRGVFLKQHGLDYRASLAAFLYERVLDLAAVVAMAALAAQAFPRYTFVLWLTLAAVAAGLWLLLSGTLTARLRWLQDRLGGRVSALAGKLVALLGDAATVLAWRPLLGGLVVGLVAWGAEGLGLYYALHALGASVSLPLTLGVYALSMLVGALSFVPGGLGTAEATMVLCLTSLGCPLPTALTATLICRAATLWFAVVLGLLACLGISLRGRLMAAASPHTAP